MQKHHLIGDKFRISWRISWIFSYNRFIFTDIMYSSLQYMYIEGVVTFDPVISNAKRAKRSIYNDNTWFEASRGHGRNLPQRPYRSLVRFCVTSIFTEICFIHPIIRSYCVWLCISRLREVDFHVLSISKRDFRSIYRFIYNFIQYHTCKNITWSVINFLEAGGFREYFHIIALSSWISCAGMFKKYI